MADRWATFDCYGTLIDWNGGIAGELARLFGEGEAPRLLGRYHELEPQVQAEDPERTYRTVLALTLERLADGENLQLPDGEHDALARSLPAWTPFPEVPDALEEARGRGWRLAILSNTDRDFIVAASLYHDVAPANELGLKSVWVNRLGETAGPAPTREVEDLSGLAAVLDELVPA
jgi:2-haloacid dehalogenase